MEDNNQVSAFIAGLALNWKVYTLGLIMGVVLGFIVYKSINV